MGNRVLLESLKDLNGISNACIILAAANITISQFDENEKLFGDDKTVYANVGDRALLLARK